MPGGDYFWENGAVGQFTLDHLIFMICERRLLYLLPFAPCLDATNGGNKVIAQILTRMVANHKLCLVYLRGMDEPPIDEQIRQSCDCAIEVIRPWSGHTFTQRWIRRSRLVFSLMGGKPMWVTDWYSREYSEIALSVIEKWQPDILHVEFHIMGQYLPDFRDCKAYRVLTLHESGESSAPFITSSNQLAQWLNRYDRRVWRGYEKAVLQEVDAVVVFTDRENQAIARHAPGTRIVKIPFGTEIPENPQDLGDNYPPRLLFFGSFIHPPNLDAALRLAKSIFPSLHARFPELELYIVGDQPPLALQRVANEKIIITGRVPDLAPHLARASIVVAPLRLGGGMRVKVLETLAAGKALVATPLAVEGLAITDREQVILAESDADFVQAIINLLTDPERRAALANRARAWASENLGWEKSIAAYEALYSDLIEGS